MSIKDIQKTWTYSSKNSDGTFSPNVNSFYVNPDGLEPWESESDA